MRERERERENVLGNFSHYWTFGVAMAGRFTYAPIFVCPTPPFQALTKLGSVYSSTGLKVPVSKYGPTGPVIQ